MVETAFQWQNLGMQLKCRVGFEKSLEHHYLYDGGIIMLNVDANQCQAKDNQSVIEPNKIMKLEHVQLKVSLNHICRGRVSLILISPSGTKSPILKPRPFDKSRKGIQVVLLLFCIYFERNGCLNLSIFGEKILLDNGL